MLKQIVHSVYMQQIIRFLPVRSRIERVGILRIGGDLQVGTIDCKKAIAVICFLFANTVSKMMKQRFKSSRENFSSLLNKSRSRRACWIQVKKSISSRLSVPPWKDKMAATTFSKGSFRFRVLSFPGFRENSCFSAASFLIESANVRLTCLIVTHLTPCSFVSQWTLPNYKGLFAYFGKQRGRTFLSFCQVLCKKNPPTRFFYPHRRWVD